MIRRSTFSVSRLFLLLLLCVSGIGSALFGQLVERTITFDDPDLDGQSPYLLTQRFRFENPVGLVYVNGAVEYKFGPFNGTAYLRTAFSETPQTFFHQQGLLFDLKQIDIGEFSTSIRGNPVFTGFKENGDTVTFTAILDKVIDADGPLEDFETIVLPDTFTELSRVEIAGSAMYDNIVVCIHGVEVPAYSPMLPPNVIYDINWNELDLFKSNAVTEVGRPNAPSYINFDSPAVRDRVEIMMDRPLEMRGGNEPFSIIPHRPYEQFSVRAERGAEVYRAECDVLILGFEMNLFFDTSNFLRLDVRNGSILLLHYGSEGSFSGNSQRWPRDTVAHLDMRFFRRSNRFEIYVNGVLGHSDAFTDAGDPMEDDLSRFRVSSTSPGAAIDNLRLYAYETEEDFEVVGPEMWISSEKLDFETTQPGEISTQTICISNRGDELLFLEDIESSNPAFIVEPVDSLQVAPSGNAYIKVKFAPLEAAEHTGTISFTSNSIRDPGMVAVSGCGLDKGLIAPVEKSLSLFLEPGETGTFRLAIRNYSTGEVNWTSEFGGFHRDRYDPFHTSRLNPDDDTTAPETWISHTAGTYSAPSLGLTSEVITVDSTGLEVGNYRCVYRVFSDSLPGGSFTVPCNLYVRETNENRPIVTENPVTIFPAVGVEPALAVSAIGKNLSYQWYEGEVGDESQPLGTTSSMALGPILSSEERTFWVAVSNESGTVFSHSASVKTSAEITAAPEVSATQDKHGKIELKWSSSSPGETFFVFRRRAGEDEFSALGQVTESSFVDTNVEIGSEYEYQIVSFNVENNQLSRFSQKTTGIRQLAIADLSLASRNKESIGGGIVNRTAFGQTVFDRSKKLRSLTYTNTITNSGQGEAEFQFRATRGSRLVKNRYFETSASIRNVTAQVVAGGLPTESLAGGESTSVDVRVRPTAKLRKRNKPRVRNVTRTYAETVSASEGSDANCIKNVFRLKRKR